LGAQAFWGDTSFPNLVCERFSGHEVSVIEIIFPTFLSAKLGTQVIVPYRDEDEKRHLKPMGDLGQIVSMVNHLLSVHYYRGANLWLVHRNGISGTRTK